MPEAPPETTCEVVIVNYNAGTKLAEAVASVLASPAVSQVLVVDNRSSDDSLQHLEGTFPDQPRLIVMRNPVNAGFAAGCNLARPHFQAPCQLFLNPDCRLEPGALEVMLGVLQETPRAGMVGPLLQNPDGSEQAGGRRGVPTPWRSFVRAFGLSRLSRRYPRLFSDFLLHTEPLPEGPLEVEAISGACMLVRRSAMEQVGPLDEGYFMHCEDLDWCMRFRQAGWRILFVPGARVLHHLGACSRSRPLFVEWHKHKGMLRFYRKFFRHQYPGVLMGLVALGVWLRFGAVAAYHLVQRLRHPGGGPP